MLFDTLYELMRAGGPVMWPIILIGGLGFYLTFDGYYKVGRDFWRRGFAEFFQSFRLLVYRGDIEKARELLSKRPGLLTSHLMPALDLLDWDEERLRNHLQLELTRQIDDLDRGLLLISVAAGTAPLLGLLGTVTGMVSTFETITLYGNQNPVLMADGISEALITTQSGLLIAFPLVLFRHRLVDRIEWTKRQLELGATILLNQCHRRHTGAR